jgi:hypothetical protein
MSALLSKADMEGVVLVSCEGAIVEVIPREPAAHSATLTVVEVTRSTRACVLQFYLATGKDLPSATLRLDDFNGPILGIINRDRHYWESLFNRARGRHCRFFAAERTFHLSIHP